MKPPKKNVENPFEKYSDEELIAKARELIFDIRNIPFHHDVTPIIQEIFKTREVFINECTKEKYEEQGEPSNKTNARLALINALEKLLQLLVIEKDETEHALNNSWSIIAYN